VILLLWVGSFHFDRSLVPGRAWFVFAVLWLIWPVALSLRPTRSLFRVLVPSALGLAMIAPYVPTLWSFAMWSIGGFAS
jgi:hypothetical protein